ncbi:MAG: hypothetical protein K9M10_00375 [Candidatus Pacebacteria bacterium]|nr:hypothetical protein [Candidatus Paceibacterota bacterium]MCF7856917.1 hypothetical protein [Candidatus Paceibacterota bacterium]
MKRVLKKVLPKAMISMIRRLKAYLVLIMREYGKYRTEQPEECERIRAEQVSMHD